MNRLTNCINFKESCLPIWFMRQAGRYLPEFREIRAKNPDFINLCLNSTLSSEITLQPIKRFDLDAAIIFSDILMVPYALNQTVKFNKETGPMLSEFNINSFLKISESEFVQKLNPVYKAIKITRSKLHKEKSLISFVGSPWTLIIYMLGLKKYKDVLNLDKLKVRAPEIKIILEKINFFLKIHINKQIEAGADIVQIFDSWAGLIPENSFEKYCLEPNRELVNLCRSKNIPVITFPKGISEKYSDFVKFVKPDVISIDYDLNPGWARENLKNVCIQGGIDPKFMLLSEKDLFDKVDNYLKIFKDYPYIFNLGHGILPETEPLKVKKLIDHVRKYK